MLDYGHCFARLIVQQVGSVFFGNQFDSSETLWTMQSNDPFAPNTYSSPSGPAYQYGLGESAAPATGTTAAPATSAQTSAVHQQQPLPPPPRKLPAAKYSRSRRAFVLFSVLACLIGCCFQIVYLNADFFQLKTISVREIEGLAEEDIPGITICQEKRQLLIPEVQSDCEKLGDLECVQKYFLNSSIAEQHMHTVSTPDYIKECWVPTNLNDRVRVPYFNSFYFILWLDLNFDTWTKKNIWIWIEMETEKKVKKQKTKKKNWQTAETRDRTRDI